MKFFAFPSAVAALLILVWSGSSMAHDKSLHGKAATGKTPAMPASLPAPAGPFDKIGGGFILTDHFGEQRSDTDFRGRFMLIFFGYANCESICPVGLRRMAAALDRLSSKAQDRVQPLLITVDPENDTPEALRHAMPKIHPRLIGLTGTPEQLRAARKAYQIDSKLVSQSADGKPVFSHGSFIYLMRPDGKFATLIPPILGDEQMARILDRYVF